MIVRETFLPQGRYRRQSTKNGIFYYVLLQEKGSRRRYLKIGTSERGATRFFDRDYKEKYSFVKILYIAECDNINDIYNLEDLNKAILRNQKGFTWHKNDRFCYFKLPNELPRCEKFNEYVSIKIA